MFRFFSVLAALGLSFSTPAFAQSDMDRCVAATPQFPQACPCVIERSQAQGITGTTLSRLLSNDTGGLPIDVFQRYGLIYVQCIQDAVLGNVGTGAPAPSVAAPAPSVTPTPSAPTPAPTPQPAAAPPVISERPYTQYPADPFVMSMRDPLPAGQWGFVGFERPGVGFGGPGVHNGAGQMISLRCRAFDLLGRPSVTLGGVAAFDTIQNLEVTVRRGNGAELYNRQTRAIPIMGPFLTFDLSAELADAIRAGSTLEIAVLDGPRYQFGLAGSNAAIGPGLCGSQSVRFDSYLLNIDFVPNTGWEITESDETGQFQPIVTARSGPPYQPSIALSCDRRLILRSAIFGYGGFPYTGNVSVDNYRGSAPSYPITWADRGGYIATDALDAALWQALQTGEVLGVTFNSDVEPGEFTTASYRLDGLAGALGTRDCANPLGERPATPVTDLTGLGLAWVPVDFGRAFDGMSEVPPVVPGAALTAPGDVPGLNVECNGEVFLFDGWSEPSFFLRMEIDGDPATDRVVGWSVSRAQAFPDFEAYPFEARILTGQTLRITWRDGSGRDVLYPLTGVRAALQAAGC